MTKRADDDRPHAPQQFELRLEPHRESIVVAAQGEIDAATSGQLRAQLRELLGAGFKRVVVDLRGVDFIDSSGLRAILEMHMACRGTQVDFALIQGPQHVRRLFEMTGTIAQLRFVDVRELDRS
jgi:anti-sigma B factor antagonist